MLTNDEEKILKFANDCLMPQLREIAANTESENVDDDVQKLLDIIYRLANKTVIPPDLLRFVAVRRPYMQDYLSPVEQEVFLYIQDHNGKTVQEIVENINRHSGIGISVNNATPNDLQKAVQQLVCLGIIRPKQQIEC